MAALLMTALLGFVGLAIDAGIFYADRRQTQNAADEAATAAARVLANGGTTADAQATALEYVTANGYDDGVTVNIPPASGDYAGQPDHVQVVVENSPNTFFIHVVVPDTGAVRSTGVATHTVSAGEAYALFAADSDCGNPDTLEVSGNLNLVNGGVHSNGNAKVPGNNNEFNGGFTYNCNLTVSGNNNTFSPPASTGPVQPLPVNYAYADFPCTRTFSADTDLRSVSNIWVGGDPNSNQLLPGVYCSTGKLTISGGAGVSGSVTLAAQGEINISGNGSNLSPYWNNILLFTENSSSSALDISGNANSWEGLVLAPNGRAKVQGETNSSLVGAIFADTIQISGQGFSITAVDYGQGGPTRVALVE